MPGPGQNIDLIQFVGGMDTDSPNEAIGKGWVRGAYDIIWRGPVGNRRPESNYGTNLVPNALLPNTGTHLTLKALYDAVYKRVFFWNYNSAGHHGIYVYNTAAQPIATFQILLQTGLNTVGDPLGFTPSGRISSAEILYADAPLGPILFYVDSLGRPTQININRYLAGTYPAVQRSYIDVIKPPPIMAPQVTYENDYTVQANGLINSLWKFAYAWLDDNNEKTVISTACKLPLPTVPFDPTQNSPTYLNARIALYLQTGDPTVKSLRIYGKETKNGATTDWMILQDIKKSDFSIPDNSIYRYEFFNTGSYITEDPAFAVLDFDVVPLQANCMTLLNGTTPAYAGILEGYDFFNPVLNVTASNQTIPRYTVNGTLFFAAPNGLFTGSQPQIQLFLTGAGQNDGNGNPTFLTWPPNLLAVRAKSGSTDISFSYSNSLQSNIVNILNSLKAAAIAAGWTFVTSDTNSITLYYPTGTVVLQSSYVQGFSNTGSNYNFPQLAFYDQAAYQWGALYFDSGGRTNGVISNVKGQITTPMYAGTGTQTPEITLDVSGYKPPPWGVYWRPCRTDNLTYGLRLDWISDAAYMGSGQLVNVEYAYFGVTSIQSYNLSVGATQGVISYGATSFSPGDRIRVLGRYAANLAFTSLNLDYAILSVVVNPVIAGVVKIGTFIQIAYPAGDISGNFKFDGTSDFQNYKIRIYNYKAQNTSSQNVFFEIGETFGIGNAGQSNAYHMGNVADNIVKISDGDIFFRPRTVPLQNEYAINCTGYDQKSTYSTLNVNPPFPSTPIVDNGIWRIVGGAHINAALDAADYPTYGDNDYTIINEGAVAFNVRFRGTLPVVDKQDPNGQFALYAKIVTSTGVTTPIVIPLQTGLAVGASNNFIFDTTIVLPPTAKLWLVAFAVNEMLIGGMTLTLDVIRNIPIFVFDSSFSDIYNLKVNSDNRPSVIDTTAKQTFFLTLFRFAEPYVPGSNIYQANRFFDANKDEFSAAYGQVQRMLQWQKRLRVAQERKWGEVGVYAKFIKNNNGTTQLIVNDQIIEQNNIQYFDQDFGIGNQRDCLAVNDYQIWFFDPVRGAICRLSLDGIKQISEEFLVQTFAGSLTPAYLNNYAYPFGGNAVVLGCYDFTKDRYAETLMSFQQGTLAGMPSLPAQTITFVEKTNLFSSFYRFAPDAMVCAENQLISFSQGQLYIHNDSGSNRTYYGTPIISQLDLIFNDQEAIRKTYQALSYQPFNNKLWSAKNVGDINTSFFNPQTSLQQISRLDSPNFEIVEGQANAALLRDANSKPQPAPPLLEGDYLKGYWLRVLLTAPDNGFNALFAPLVRWTPSMKTP